MYTVSSGKSRNKLLKCRFFGNKMNGLSLKLSKSRGAEDNKN